MTRLTDEQIDNVVHDVRQALGGKAWYRHFADRIAALAVQEVERERELAVNAHNHAHRRCAELELAHDRLRAEVATLTAQLAEVTKERDIARGRTEIRIEECVEYQNEIVRLRAQLATAKREAFVAGSEWYHSPKMDVHAEARNRYPATPSGELCDADCGCPSPEAREVPSEVVLRVEDAYATDYGSQVVRITPADAKRIVRLAQEATNG
jgi:hypothetical protein